MHVLFVHQNFPAQFGHIAHHLIQHHGFRCSFVSQRPAAVVGGIENISYQTQGGATAKTHYCSRTFENQIWHSHAVFQTLSSRADIQPDLIVGHSGFASTLFLRELYTCPIINYFEYFYRTIDSDMDFRKDLPNAPDLDRLRARARNALLLLDLENCDAGYSPTQWQHQQLPSVFQDKIDVIFDGIDTSVWHPRDDHLDRIAAHVLPAGKRIVTYVSRGLESMRGFDIFMRVAKRICDARDDVVFVVVGEDRVAYGGDERFTEGQTFKQWVLAQEDYDLDRILFIGRIPPRDLACLLARSDLHFYLTVPFVLSWSMMNAMACGCVVLAGDVGPVREMIRHGENGLLADFFDVEGLAEAASRVLDDPQAHAPLGQAAAQMIDEHYSLERCLAKMLALYQRVVDA